MDYKVCANCKNLLPLAEFYKRKNSKDGHSYQCKECLKLKSKIHYEENKKIILQKHKTYRDTHNENIKAYRKSNIKKLSEYQRKYRQNHRQENILYLKKYRENHKNDIRITRLKNSEKRRVGDSNRRSYKNKVNGVIVLSDWEKCLHYFNNKCGYCGIPLTMDNLSLEHIIPINRKGRNSIDNVIPACKNCNSSKRDREFTIWYKQQVFFSKERVRKINNWIRKAKS